MIKKRVEALESKYKKEEIIIVFIDDKASKEDCIRYNLPLNITLSEAMKLYPNEKVIEID